MSRSTPLENLPNVKNNQQPPSNAYDENENQLVKDILNEIDSEKSNNQQQQPQQPQQPQQQLEQQQNQENISQHMNEQEMMHNQMLENAQLPNQFNSLSIQDKIMLHAKQPLIVGLIAVIISIPSISAIIEGFIISKASLASYSSILILVIKGLIAGALYYGINQNL